MPEEHRGIMTEMLLLTACSHALEMDCPQNLEETRITSLSKMPGSDHLQMPAHLLLKEAEST